MMRFCKVSKCSILFLIHYLTKILADKNIGRESNDVKILNFKNKASDAAKQLLDEAQKNEPAITKDLKSIAALNNSELTGLENKFKDENSLTDKLCNNAIKLNSSITAEAKRNNDTLRYTMIFSPDDYRNGYSQVLNELESRGYKLRKIWNAWATAETVYDSGYRGINVTVISSQKQKFELQFHTVASFRVKTETHNLYEEKRDPKTSLNKRLELNETMKTIAQKIERPKGV